jgi:DNA-binding beta-propeller fold protein YncE
MQYTVNSSVGILVAGGNGGGNNNTQLNSPRGLYFDSITNSLFIANSAANNVVQWVIGAFSWTLVAGDINGGSGGTSTTLFGPWDVTLDPMGNVYIADRFNCRIQLFLSGQINGTTIAGVTGSCSGGSTTLNEPISVVLDGQLNLYVADLESARIQKFAHY